MTAYIYIYIHIYLFIEKEKYRDIEKEKKEIESKYIHTGGSLCRCWFYRVFGFWLFWGIFRCFEANQRREARREEKKNKNEEDK